MTEDEAETVAKLAAAVCQDGNTRALYAPVMRYGRLSGRNQISRELSFHPQQT